VVLQVSESTYETKTQAIARKLLSATRENRSFLAQMRDQMRWVVDDEQSGLAGTTLSFHRLFACTPQ
jgi:hypothetical protein